MEDSRGVMPVSDILSDLHASLRLLAGKATVIEVRLFREDGTGSGYYADYAKAAADLQILDADSRISGIYVTLNEVDPTLLARRANRIKFRLGKKESSTADADIIRRCWLPIDIDPVRPSGVSSSEAEHADALVRVDSIARFLADKGWADPVIADSGNGAHLLYRIDLPNDDASRILIKSVLETLDRRFTDSRCKVDTVNSNAARIWKVYGTVSRKGDNLPDRPHRRSRILSIPTEGIVSADQLKALVGEVPAPPAKMTIRQEQGALFGGTKIDLASWLTEYGLSYTAKPYQDGTIFVLDACPFSEAHTDGAFAIQFSNGALFAGCHHNSCGGGRQRWQELRARFEPTKPDVGERLAKLRSDRIRQKNEAEGRVRIPDTSANLSEPDLDRSLEVEPAESVVDETIRIRSTVILTTGDPLAFLLETFAKSHVGDQTVAECLIHSLVSRTVINSKGLHVSITGESGKGKSHAIDTMRTLIPEAFRLDGRLSDKALFYMEDLQPGTVITLDDVSLSDQMQEILKGVTTSFQKPFPYRTVNKDRRSQTCMIPERCVWWIAKVEGSGDDQVFNRMLTCWIDDSEEQDLKVLDRTLEGAAQMPGSLVQTGEEVQVCQQMWEDLAPVWVVIPYATRIRFQSVENRRNPDMLLDLIRTNAALNQRQRETTVVAGTTCVIASREDFDQAARLFVTLNGETGAQGDKLTKRESALIDAIASFGIPEVTVAQLQRVTGFTNSSIGKLLHGYRSYGKSYTGILEKCPAVSYLDRTVTKGDEGCTTMRRNRVYLWDEGLYAAWVKGGSVWLLDDEGESPDPPGSPGGIQPDGDDSVSSRTEGASAMDDGPEGSPAATGEAIPPDSTGDGFVDFRSIGESLDEGLVDPGGTSVDGMSHSEGMMLADVHPNHFFLVDGIPDRRSCSVCGKRPTQYQERMTPERMRQPPRMNHMLCAACYQRAVSREIASIVPLPGVIEPTNLVRRTSSVGKCQICSLMPAVWSDPGERIHVCDRCYRRLLDKEGSPVGKSPPVN